MENGPVGASTLREDDDLRPMMMTMIMMTMIMMTMMVMTMMTMTMMMMMRKRGVEGSAGGDDSSHARDYRDYTVEGCLPLVTNTDAQWMMMMMTRAMMMMMK